MPIAAQSSLPLATVTRPMDEAASSSHTDFVRSAISGDTAAVVSALEAGQDPNGISTVSPARRPFEQSPREQLLPGHAIRSDSEHRGWPASMRWWGRCHWAANASAFTARAGLPLHGARVCS